MKKFAILAMLAAAGSAYASVATFNLAGSATFTNKNSIDAQGDPDNARDSAILNPGGLVNAIRVNGTLTEINTATFVSEARVRMSAGAGNSFTAFNVQASTVGGFTGTAVVSSTVGVTPFTLAAGGTVDFEWFESLQDGTANLPEARWDTVTYEFGSSVVTNGNANLGTLVGNGVTQSYSGSHVSGGLDFITFTINEAVTNVGDYLNISMLAGPTGGMTDTEIALYSSAGLLLADSDDDGPGFFSEMSFGAADPLAAPDLTPGLDGLSLPAGTYTIVTGGFNTIFSPNIANITPGTNAGTYVLNVTFVPAPGALALAGLGGLIAARRRR
ncbi:MAG: hypothetical protein SFZ23_16240 [Planctomycetota bacterium]|nr:hypothetical protein [Planctomycetota bacterium]